MTVQGVSSAMRRLRTSDGAIKTFLVMFGLSKLFLEPRSACNRSNMSFLGGDKTIRKILTVKELSPEAIVKSPSRQKLANHGQQHRFGPCNLAAWQRHEQIKHFHKLPDTTSKPNQPNKQTQQPKTDPAEPRENRLRVVTRNRSKNEKQGIQRS